MKKTMVLLLLVLSPPCLAQKWIDDKGKVYYGSPPPGINVREAPMTGGATSSVGAQPSAPGTTRAERQFQERAGNRAAAEASTRRQQESNRKLNESAREAKQKQQEQFQQRQAQDAARYRREQQARCRAMNTC